MNTRVRVVDFTITIHLRVRQSRAEQRRAHCRPR